MATDDRDRWLIAWAWHNPEAEDPVWSVMLAFQQMNRRLTAIPTGNDAPWTEQRLSEAEAIARSTRPPSLAPSGIPTSWPSISA